MTETDSSLEQRHARFQTPEALIFDLIKDQTGCAPVKRTKIVRGYDNEVYDVATREGSAFIVKIKQYGEMSFEQEQWAMDRCGEVGVPVPRTYAIGSVQIAEKEREYLIQEKASGRPLAESIYTLSRSQITHVFHQAGELLRRGAPPVRTPGLWCSRAAPAATRGHYPPGTRNRRLGAPRPGRPVTHGDAGYRWLVHG